MKLQSRAIGETRIGATAPAAGSASLSSSSMFISDSCSESKGRERDAVPPCNPEVTPSPCGFAMRRRWGCSRAPGIPRRVRARSRRRGGASPGRLGAVAEARCGRRAPRDRSRISRRRRSPPGAWPGAAVVWCARAGRRAPLAGRRRAATTGRAVDWDRVLPAERDHEDVGGCIGLAVDSPQSITEDVLVEALVQNLKSLELLGRLVSSVHLDHSG